jgi:serine protease Do
MGLKKAEGALVTEPQPDSPAAKAGIASGDVITGVNGTPVKDARELTRTIGGMTPGSNVKLNLLHKGQEKTVDLTLGVLPNQREARASVDGGGDRDRGRSQRGAELGRLGMTVAPADSVAGAGKEGVVVTEIERGSPAAERGLKEGDVILEVGGKLVSNPADVRDAIVAARGDNKNTVLVRVRSGGSSRFVAVPLGRG